MFSFSNLPLSSSPPGYYLAEDELLEDGREEEEENLHLSYEISDFLKQYTVNIGGKSYQCLLCSATFRDKFNAKDHMFRKHVANVPELMLELNELVQESVIHQSSGANYTCMLCRKVLKKRTKMDMTLHFVVKHLNVSY